MSLTITVGFCFAIFVLWAFFMIRWTDKSVTQAPALLTMVGIAGTFTGIALGLISFRSTDVQGSIPGLIDGIRTAVWASLFGVVSAIVLKLRYALERSTSSEDDTANSDPLANELKSLRRAITGDEDSSVISQMKLARVDMNSHLTKIAQSQDAFMKQLAEMSSKAIVEALREVVADFNKNLNEQFGENFKQLNEAVGKLLIWQEQYKDQLSTLIAAEETTAKQMTAAVDQYAAALASTQSLVKVADDLRAILETVSAYKTALAENTERLSGLIDTMKSATPALRDEIQKLITSVSETIVRSESEVERIGADITARFNAASDAIQQGLTSSLTTANKEVNDNIARLIGSTKESTEALQIGLEESLTTALDQIARQFTSISGKFAEDYGPIADRLREIVQATR